MLINGMSPVCREQSQWLMMIPSARLLAIVYILANLILRAVAGSALDLPATIESDTADVHLQCLMAFRRHFTSKRSK